LDFTEGNSKPDKRIITSLNLTKIGFIRNFWPKRFHKIDSRHPCT
jgi:hypothetical protein